MRTTELGEQGRQRAERKKARVIGQKINEGMGKKGACGAMVMTVNFILKTSSGIPVVAQWKRIPLGTTRWWVPPVTSVSEVRIWRCRELWCRSQTRLGSGMAVAVALGRQLQPQFDP